MRALILDRSGTLSLADRVKPSPASECVVRVLAAGICGTDLELMRGYAGFSGGREGAFAEYLSLPAANLHAVPDEVADEAAVLVAALRARDRQLGLSVAQKERQIA